MISRIRNYLLASDDSKSNIFLICAIIIIGPNIFFMLDNSQKKAKYIGEVQGTPILKNLYYMKVQELSNYFDILKQFFDKNTFEYFTENQFGSNDPKEIILNQFISRYLYHFVANKINIYSLSDEYIKSKISDKKFITNEMSEVFPFSLLNENEIETEKLNNILKSSNIQGEEFEKEILYFFENRLVNNLLNMVSDSKIKETNYDFYKNIELKKITVNKELFKKSIKSDLIFDDTQLESYFNTKNMQNSYFYSKEKRFVKGWKFKFENDKEQKRLISEIKLILSEDSSLDKILVFINEHKNTNFTLDLLLNPNNNDAFEKKVFNLEKIGNYGLHSEEKEVTLFMLEKIESSKEIPFSKIKESVIENFIDNEAEKALNSLSENIRKEYEDKMTIKENFFIMSKTIYGKEAIEELKKTKPSFISREKLSWVFEEKNNFIIYFVKKLNSSEEYSKNNKIKDNFSQDFGKLLIKSLKKSCSIKIY